MKKIISLTLLISMLLLCFASCGKKESKLFIDDFEKVMKNADSEISLTPKDGDNYSYTYSDDGIVNPVTYTVSCDKKGNITYISITSSEITTSMITSSSSITTIMNKNPGSMTMAQLKVAYLVMRLSNLIEFVSQEGSSLSYYNAAASIIANSSSRTYGDWTVDSAMFENKKVLFTATFAS